MTINKIKISADKLPAWLEEKKKLWTGMTYLEVAKKERISPYMAKKLMKKAGLVPESPMKRLERLRKEMWRDKTAFEIHQNIEPKMSVPNIRAYAINHNIRLKQARRGRPKNPERD